MFPHYGGTMDLFTDLKKTASGRDPTQPNLQNVAASRKEQMTSKPQDVSPADLVVKVMDQTALVFLEDPLARRLAVAWQATGGDEDAWYEVAGLPADLTVRRTCFALRANNICRDGGVTDPLALRYIAALVSEPLLKQARSKPRGKRK